jgi:hypothetical protein
VKEIVQRRETGNQYNVAMTPLCDAVDAEAMRIFGE